MSAPSLPTPSSGQSSGYGELLLQGGIDFGKAFLNNFFGKKSSKKQRQWDLAMWNLQNQYNHPANVMKRLKDAGLNPALMYGSGSAGMGLSSSAPSGSGRFYTEEAPDLDVLSMLKFRQDFEAKGQDIANSKAQNAILREKARTERATANLKTKSLDLVQANIKVTENRVKVLQHNLDYAIEHKLPVGQINNMRNQYLSAVQQLTKAVVFGLTYGGATAYNSVQRHGDAVRFNQMHNISVVSPFDELR